MRITLEHGSHMACVVAWGVRGGGSISRSKESSNPCMISCTLKGMLDRPPIDHIDTTKSVSITPRFKKSSWKTDRRSFGPEFETLEYDSSTFTRKYRALQIIVWKWFFGSCIVTILYKTGATGRCLTAVVILNFACTLFVSTVTDADGSSGSDLAKGLCDTPNLQT